MRSGSSETGLNGSRSSSPLITISPLNIDLLYPYYLDGYFEGLPDGLSATGFYELIATASTFMRFYMVEYNGELVAVFELRPIYQDGLKHETHTVWFTDSRKKRALSLQEFLRYKRGNKLITFVNPKESGGHFALARRGMATFRGEVNNMHVFESCQ